MAYRTQQIKLTHLIFGGSAFALLLVLTLGTVLVLWLNADIKTTLSPSDWHLLALGVVSPTQQQLSSDDTDPTILLWEAAQVKIFSDGTGRY